MRGSPYTDSRGKVTIGPIQTGNGLLTMSLAAAEPSQLAVVQSRIGQMPGHAQNDFRG